MQGLGYGFRELVYYGTGSILFLGAAHGEHRREDTLHMPYILQALGHLCEAFGNQGLDVFTQGTLPIPQSRERVRTSSRVNPVACAVRMKRTIRRVSWV